MGRFWAVCSGGQQADFGRFTAAGGSPQQISGGEAFPAAAGGRQKMSGILLNYIIRFSLWPGCEAT